MPLRARTNLWVRSLKVTRPKRSPCFSATSARCRAASTKLSRISCARRKPRGIDHRVDFLGMLHAVQLHHRELAPRGGLPVDVLESVAGQVLAQVVEFAAFAHLAMHAQADLAVRRKSAAVERSRRLG